MKRMRHLLNLEKDPICLNHEAVSLPEALVPGNPTANRPFVTLSYAQSLNGAITARRGEPMAISNSESRTMTHKLRANHDAILVGIETVLVDNPRLTVREVVGKNPQPVILDSRLRFPLEAKLLQNQDLFPWIATTEQAEPSHQQALEKAGAQVLCLPANQDGQVALQALLSQLYKKGFNSIMVEGGARVITSFLAARLVDRVVVTVAPLLMDGLNAVGKLTQSNHQEFPRLHNPHHQWLGNDIVIFGDVTWSAK
jgi:riboflavin-specific deaminase-like protein